MSGVRGNAAEKLGRYELVTKLGEGRVTEVFRAKSFGVEGFEKTLVVKRLLPALASDETFVAAFVREAKLAVRLNHANIVQMFDLGRIDAPPAGRWPTYFVAVEYVAGLDLATALQHARRAGETPPIGLGVFVATEIAKGLDHAHRRRDDANQPLGIVHGEVAPHNMLVSWEGEVKIDDFGIAKARESADAGHVLKAKYAYLSPEQASGEAIDARSDIFSLGTLLYETLAGVNPFHAPTMPETLRRVRASDFPPLELLRHEIPAELAAIVRRALALDPAERPTAGRLHEDLVALLYALGGRFGTTELADFVGRFRETAAPSKLPAGHVLSPPPEPTDDRIATDPPEGPPTEARPGLVRRLSSTEREVSALVVCAGTKPAGAWATRTRDYIERYGGHVLDGEPNEVVGLFGLDAARGRETELAVHAAVASLAAASTLGERAGAGVDIGRVRKDAPGLPPDEAGAALVRAARSLARAAESNGVVFASADAAREARGRFAFVDAAQSSAAPAGATSVDHELTPYESQGRFVGRRNELRQLGSLLAVASSRSLRVVTLVGAVGVGKTRLLREIARRLHDSEFDVGFAMTACAPGEQAIPLAGLASMLRAIVNVPLGTPPSREAEARLRVLGLRGADLAAALAAIDAREHAAAGAIPQAFERVLHGLSRERLSVFAWDDADALDAASIDALREITSRGAAARVVFVFAGDESFVNLLEGLAHHDRISLGRLSDEEALRLLAVRLGANEVPADLVAYCSERAGGEPLFIEELLLHLVAAGDIEVRDSRVTEFHAKVARAVPRRLATVIRARADRLPPDERALVRATGTGEVFNPDAAAARMGGSIAAAARALASLERRGIVYPRSDGRFAFTSPLWRDVLTRHVR